MLRAPPPARSYLRLLVAAVALGVLGVSVVWFTELAVVPLLRAYGARAWQATTCTITRADVHVDPDADTNYRMRFEYRYEVGGTPYRGTRLDFVDGHEEGHSYDLHRRYPGVGAQVPCYYDPAAPEHAVVRRTGWLGLRALAPLGGIALALALVTLRRTRLHERRHPDGRMHVWRRNASGGIVWVALGLTVIFGCLGITADAPLWPGLLLGVPALPSFALLVYKLCAFATKIHVELADRERTAGDPLHARCRISGPVSTTSIHARLVCREVSRWQEGSNARIDLRELHARDAADASVPVDALPSLSIGDNTIEWAVEIRAELPLWPDVRLDIPLVVHGATRAPREPAAVASLPANAPIGIVLDGGRDTFAPGEPIAGTLGWTRTTAPTDARVVLWWRSQATNVLHREIVGEVAVAELPRLVEPDRADPYRGTAVVEVAPAPLAARDRRRLRFVAPAAPFTHAGQVFQVDWGLDLVLRDGDDGATVTQPLTIDGRR